MKIEIALYCHRYERRLCWMLSSMLQQVGDLPEIVVSVAYLKGGRFDGTVDSVLALFREQGLNCSDRVYKPEECSKFQKRSLVRNDQLARTDADWIWFGDCDMVLQPDFFATAKRLFTELDGETRMLFTGRHSTKLDETEELIDYEGPYPCVVPDAHALALQLPSIPKSNIGAGFCQIWKVEPVRSRFGVYVPPEECRDNSWDKYWKTRSDRWLRGQTGKLAVDLPWFVHLQHVRDNEQGEHVEVPR